ncbi:hypothetical protein MN032_10815 [Agromyces atrinae]|uniref:hypothetical protein n=1 Tax=Agromyces atrinae TaxID=592376 RepID=UPI001F580106|nr:hypothetical protein [Agromyces atrinae]MCI2958188.1 hypothetical protein [Agromyces atrinae]
MSTRTVDADVDKSSEIVRAAKAKLENAKRTAPAEFVPRIDARIAVLNADLIDRRTGITSIYETTPGIILAGRVLVRRP